MTNATVASKVVARLREEIICGKLSEGEHITIKEIADTYHVSHMPVREAFRVLEGEKLLEIVPYRGAVVRKIDETFFLEILDICDALEAHMAAIAMMKMSENDLQQLESINREMLALKDTPKDLKRHLDLNTAFHSCIFSCAGNTMAQSVHGHYHSLARMVRGRYRHSYARVQAVAAEHAMIIDAMRRQDAFDLKRSIDLHAHNARANLIEQYHRER